MAVTKQSGQGEQIVVDVCQWNPVTGALVHGDVQEMEVLLNQCLGQADERLYQMNMRMLEAYGFEKYFHPGVWQQVVSVLDVLAGRTDPRSVIKRWDDIKEENEELEAARLIAYEQANGFVVNGEGNL